MPSTFFGLDIGTSGLHTYQGAINTTSHNIANAKTEGFSRQQLNREAKDPISIAQSYGMVGTGVMGNKITRIRDEYYDLKFRTASTINGEYDQRAYYLRGVQSYINEIKDGGFNVNFNNFFNAVSEVEKNPSSLSTRALMVNNAYALTEYFNNVAENLKNLQDEINFNIKNTVDTINSYGDQIATLTKQINIIEINGGFANDLRDKRDLVVDKLSGLVNVSVKEEVVGKGLDDRLSGVTAYTVKVNGRYLVNNYESNRIELVPRHHTTNVNDIDGLYDLAWSDGQNFDLYNTQLGGKFRALIDMRDGNNNAGFKGKAVANAGDTEIKITDTNINDIENMNFPPSGKIVVGGYEYDYESFSVDVVTDDETGKEKYEYTFKLKEGKEVITDHEEVPAQIGRQVDFKGIPYYMDQLNKFARKFSKEFNEIHKTGKDLDGNEGEDFFNGIDRATGENYKFLIPGVIKNEDGDPITHFSSTDSTYYRLTAHNYSVTRKFRENPKLLAAASSIVDGIENTDVMKKLYALQKDGSMFDDGSPEEFYQSITSDIGVDTKTANVFAENQDKVVKAINNQRLSISSVDMDEETVSLIKFKKCYDLSAKVITTMNEIYNKLINEMAI